MNFMSFENYCVYGNYFSISQLHDIFHYRNVISLSDHFQLSRNSTRLHPLTIKTASSSINSYCYSFFINSPFNLWNIFLMPSCKCSSLIYSVLLYVIFSFDCFLFIYFGCICIILCSLFMYVCT